MSQEILILKVSQLTRFKNVHNTESAENRVQGLALLQLPIEVSIASF